MNIKKYILFLSSFFLLTFSNFCLSSTKYIQNIHYELIENASKIKLINNPKTQIIEFFSFLCPHCYSFYIITNGKNLSNVAFLKNLSNVAFLKNLSNVAFLKNLSNKKYHVNIIGDLKLAELATYNWSIAIALNVEDKVIIPMFEGIQKTHKIYDYLTMRKIFIKAANIDKNIYDAAWNSFIVKGLNIKQKTLAEECNVTSIPFIVVNNNYHIILNSLDNTSTNIFLNNYTNLIKFLLKKYE
ncbi:DsbA family protein [Enterobacteriaceae endosymbiont of Plateumaris rustica]|uniref:DsbA family protein n=1 Tax=Enterobacteriaceae endosymbiont of Plateumaris rustica TaxID=2675796 RepID=UPI00144A0773|nr:DsbA family protein [Enterobacteriaceae endosymbiont of Plateumaris rustica]QJC29228.1 hypothetical protein GJT82_02035 [Enterobacteriaceae endosymbiont of Plateumaris rustica]